MKIYKIYSGITILLFSFGCLLTHKDIQQQSSSPSQEIREDIEEDIEPVLKDQTLDLTKDLPPSDKPKLPSPHKRSIAEKIAEMATSLRELRGDLARSDKEHEEQLNQLKQGLVSLIQTLDLKVTALAGEVENIKKTSPALKKQAAEDIFHKAEQFFKEEKWKSAIIHYEKYRAQNKTGKFYKSATLQMGLCFQKLEMQKEAKVFFRELVESFPKSEQALRARKLLSSPSP